MNFSREIKLGILAIIVIAGMIWGYKFVIGQNLLTASRTFYAVYDDVTELDVSAPVKINGYTIGSVTGIELNKEDVSTMRVKMEVEDTDIKFPNTTQALLANDGLVGGKYVLLRFKENCNGDNCLKDGDVMISGKQGLLGAMVDPDELKETVSAVTTGLSGMLDSIGAEGKDGAINETFRNFQLISANLAALTATTDKLLKNSQYNLQSTLKSVAEITETIAADRERISSLLTNLDSITGSLAAADIGQLIESSNTTLESTNGAITQFETTLSTTTSTMEELSSILAKLDSGEGSLSQLMNDKQLYTNLEFTSKNLALLLQDIRLNPNRYISVSVFGKDKKEYVPADEDPAFEGEWIIMKKDTLK